MNRSKENKMKLHSIEYTEFKEQTYAWILDDLSLININLIVGKNATGKSRLLRVINGLARLIEGQIAPINISSGHYKATFKDNKSEKKSPSPDIIYSLDIHDSKVIQENLYVGDIYKLKRGRDGRGQLYFEKNNTYIDVQIPETMLASATRRDSQQHNFFEVLHLWAKSVRLFEFNNTQNNEATTFEGKITMESIENGPLQNNLHLIIKLGKEHFRRDFTNAIIRDMKKIGYNITDFGLTPLTGLATNIKFSNALETLYIIEHGIDKKLLQNEISDGMLRAFATLVNLSFISLQKKFGCILIDDIGEGLDFDRATKLISVIIEQAENGFIQLIMTTNDRFIMNNVSLDYWTIMQRDEGKIKVLSKRNSPEIFSEFEAYGFNNFDLFAKGFFSNSVSERNK
jgi:AAA15 family ATPase/GTPase